MEATTAAPTHNRQVVPAGGLAGHHGAGSSAAGSAASDARAGKYLAFQLGKEAYAIRVLKVREIIGVQDITPVPQTPDYVRGVFNLRGKVIPVIDLQRKFGLQATASTTRTCIVVVELLTEGQAMLMGILVDGVSEVLNIVSAEIEDTPDFGRDISVSYLLGVAKTRGSVKLLLDIDAALQTQEVSHLSALLEAKDAASKETTPKEKVS
jgi:purine-binding chemotaxis protein CheW